MRYGLTRIIVLGFAVLFSAAFMSFGCHHSKGALQNVIKTPDDWDDTGEETRTVTAAISVIGPHHMGINFSSGMERSTVNTKVTDETGAEMKNINKTWSIDSKTLHLRGPFPFCESKNVTIFAGAMDNNSIKLDEDTTLTARMGNNPYDFDYDGYCNADAPVSLIFTGRDAALFTGDFIMEHESPAQFSQNDMNTQNIFYYDGSGNYGFAEPMAVVPAGYDDGHAGLAMLFWRLDQNASARRYMLGVWDIYDPLDELMSSTILFDAPYVTKKRFHFATADLNGDAVNDFIVSGEMLMNSGAKLQNIHLIKGPPPDGTHLLEDVEAWETTLGSSNEALTTPIGIGDFDGDGNEDAGLIRNSVLSQGKTGGYEVWLMRGNADIRRVFDDTQAKKIIGYSTRMITGLASGDVDGDGKSDIIVTELERQTILGKNVKVNPHISIFFGSDDMSDSSTISPPVDIFNTTYYYREASAAARVMGDINGDGFDDIGIMVTETNYAGSIVSSKIYIFTGRENWSPSYFMDTYMGANAVLDVTEYDKVYWDNPRIGDLNNDGYDDFKVETEEDSDLVVYWFLGGPNYSAKGFNMYLEDFDRKFVFR